MRRTRTRRFVVLTACVVESLALRCASAQTSAFPPPDRPVAPIVTPKYSTEPPRDEHGDAERVLNRLSVKPGLAQAHLDGLAARLTREQWPA